MSPSKATSEMRPVSSRASLIENTSPYVVKVPDAERYVHCNSSCLSENLGQVRYIFTDKTGTLTKNEMIIFSYLLNNREKIVTRDELMTDLWNNEDYINDNALTVNISRLRNKLSEVGYDKAIETRKGQGYILV